MLRQLKAVVVTSHLMLATLWFSCVLWMLFYVSPGVAPASSRPPLWMRRTMCVFPAAVLAQILLGGLVASSYAGSVCVDFPLCNGQWAPTFHGAIGLQVLHRFGAYFIVLFAATIAFVTRAFRGSPWATPQIARLSEWVGICAFAQMCLGVANLLLYIPPLMTVVHQSLAITLLALGYRLAFVATRGSGNLLPAMA